MQPFTPAQTSWIQRAWNKAEGVVILAGAGMSVDSGLPDFRGSSGFWTKAKESFITKATAKSFDVNPLEAWNFYIERIIQYQHTQPHEGYFLLLELLKNHNKPYFVVTSNIDGHFLKAGYDPQHLYEIHGTLRYCQCTQPCCRELTPMPEFGATLSSETETPKCPHCNKHSRPNVMMFSDPGVVWTQMDQGQESWRNWSAPKLHLFGIEIGAGTGIPSIRIFGEERTTELLRINLYESQVSRQWDLGISATALEGIRSVAGVVGTP